jgi:hypothetical protein
MDARDIIDRYNFQLSHRSKWNDIYYNVDHVLILNRATGMIKIKPNTPPPFGGDDY